jgi:uncharacterized protein
MRVWIDLANSPHPLLFSPLAERLDELGAEILITARDNAQTVELAREHFDEVAVIGGPSPRGRAAKARAIGARTRRLARRAGAFGPDVALSHNSYAQIVAARILRVPVVTAMDYEHQPANHLAFRLADRVLLPAALPRSSVARQGASAAKVVIYPGLKEELYVGRFEPDPDVLQSAGLDAGDERALVVARTPPTGASYHQFDNPRFIEALRVLSRGEVRCVVLPRYPEQAAEIEALALDRVITSHRALDSRSLIFLADAFLGAGGTMTREAAVLGVPTYSLFAGRRPLVDEWLEREGALRLVDSVEQLNELARVARKPQATVDLVALRARAKAIEDVFVDTTVAAAKGASR